MPYKIGTKDKPLVLKTPPLTSEYSMHVDQKEGKDVLDCIGLAELTHDPKGNKMKAR
jgi:hypothetical protein